MTSPVGPILYSYNNPPNAAIRSPVPRGVPVFVLLLFAFTLFVSAFLLFLVEPLIWQMILPTLGGTPAVWNTCMVFFQAALLAGYGYTHYATNNMTVKRQIFVQIALLFLPFVLFMLPFSIGDWTPATQINPIWSVLYILLITVGLSFLLVATSAPLLQRWFASTGHPASKDPYFLYGASNFGSLLALFAYPFVFQPFLELSSTALTWMFGYMGLILFVGVCGLVVRSAPQAVTLPTEKPEPPPAPLPPAEAQHHVTRRPPRQRPKPLVLNQAAPIVTDIPKELTWLRRLRWIALAAAPSSLMLGVTTFMTTDIAAIPLFTIVPLALYLISFILVFARWPVVWTGTAHRIMLYAFPILLFNLGLAFVGRWEMETIGSLLTRFVNLVLGHGWTVSHTAAMLLDHLICYFACIMVCHGELARDRPAVKHLTEFYLWMAVGGVVGGALNAFIAPVIFKEVIEYFLVLLLVPFLRPQTHFWQWIRGKKEPPDNHSLEEYLLDLGYAVCLTLLGWGLLKLSLHKTLWQPSYDFTRWLWELYHRTFVMEQTTSYWWARWTEVLLIEGIPLGICLAFAGRPLRFGLGVIGLVVVNYFMLLHGQLDYIYQNRSFFSVQSVRQESIRDEDVPHRYDEEFRGRKYRVLIHGGIDHGRQQISDDLAVRDRPISYFLPRNPIGQVFSKLKELDASEPGGKRLPFAVVGLGVGTLASYANKDQVAHFYEIDPAVLRLSGYQLDDNGKMVPLADGSEPIFYYLQDAINRGVKLDLFLGDGRLRLKDAPKDFYQVIVLDAFSSDAIPVHLLTKEAITMYLTKLREDGILVFNITNRYVKMAPALADAARELDLVCLFQEDNGEERNPESFGTSWVIMFRNKGNKRMAAEAAAAAALPSAGMLSAVPWPDLMTGNQTRAPVTDKGDPIKGFLPAMPKIDFPFLLPQLLEEWRWLRPEGTGRPAWTDSYQDLIRVMNW